MARRDDTNGALRRSIEGYLARVVGHIPFAITHDQMLEVTSTPYAAQILRDAIDVAKVYSSDRWFELEVPVDQTRVPCRFAMMDQVGQHAPLAPRHPAWMPGDTPGHRAIVDWARERVRVGTEFAKVGIVVDWLIANCEHREMRFLFPPIMHLASIEYGDTYQGQLKADFLDKYREFKAPKSMPAISRPLRQALQDAAGTLTMASMIEDAPPTKQFVVADIIQANMSLVEVDNMAIAIS